ncbi:MAG: BON domain-containing protein [Planctomycetota bacterium]|jgi:osmotically-inducible protein OsmY
MAKTNFLLLLAAAALLWGCTPRTGSPEAADQDHRINREVKVLLEQDPTLRGIWPSCREGVVTLTGKVTSREACKKALRLADDISGVREVINKIEIHEK